MLRRPKTTKPSGLSFEHAAFAKKGPTLALDVPMGSSVAVMGTAGSGKSQMLRIIAGIDQPARGEVVYRGSATLVDEPDWLRRDTPISVAKSVAGKGSLQKVSEAISLLGLWDARQQACHSLSPAQRAAASFIPVLLGNYDLVAADQSLDHLDWQVRESLWSALKSLRNEGMIFAYATHWPELGERADLVLVLKNEAIAFSGSPEALKRTVGETLVTVTTENRLGARAIADAFEIEVEETPNGIRFRAKEGQALAAKLLLEGYGDVRFVVSRPPTFSESLTGIAGS